MVEIVWSNNFKRSIESIKHQQIKEKILSKIEKVATDPLIGKPLRHSLKGERSVRVNPYRLIYTISDNKLTLVRFEHREKVYKK